MNKALTRRLDTLEAERASAQAAQAGDWSIPISFVDEDGHVVGTIPARRLPPRNAMGLRVFDFNTMIAELVDVMGYEHGK
jgi:hypothetical protein